MRRLVAGLIIIVATFVLFPTRPSSQSGELRVLEASPSGEINQPSDANEIRVIFSEPMVALGRIPSNPAPTWIHIAPAIKGTFRWSGTSVLIFSPDPASPLPYATRYTVSIDAGVTSVAGRSLASPYAFSFTTPTIKLTSLRWYRRQNRFDQPVLLALGFNQPVRAADVARLAVVRYEPYTFETPDPRRGSARTARRHRS